MGILAKVGASMQRLFGEVALEAADESGVIQRTRIFTPMSLAKTFVLGFLQNPRASDEKLAQMAAQCGAAVTPQAIEKRHTPQMVAFMKKLFCEAAKIIVKSDKSLARSSNGSRRSLCWTVQQIRCLTTCKESFAVAVAAMAVGQRP